MRIAILSDVHADAAAVRDVLARIDQLGCDRIVCAGDLVDYGDDPEATIELLREHEVPCIRGNHDRWALARTRGQSASKLSAPILDYLAALPASWHAEIDGVRIAMFHGSPRSDMDGIDPDVASLADARGWLQAADADVLVVGHTHRAFALAVFGGKLVVNPGALLRVAPDVAPNGGSFGVLELPSKVFRVYRASDGTEVDIPRIALGIGDRR